MPKTVRLTDGAALCYEQIVKMASVLLWVLLTSGFVHSGYGQEKEKDGLRLTVTKATLSRDDQRGPFLDNTDRIDRTQGLKVNVANVSFNPMSEGELEWEILVHKYNSTSITSYRGTENLKALGKAQSVDLTIGAVPIEGYHYGTVTSMDKIDWQIVVKRQGVEVFRASSNPNFAALEQRANPARKKGD